MAEELKNGLDGGGDGAKGNGGANGGDGKTYTEAELKSEVDRRVDEAVITAQKKWQEQQDEAIAAAVKKAEERAKMTADERAKADFAEKEKAFNDERAKYNTERLEFDCTRQLAAAGLPVEFAKMLTGADEDGTKSNIGAFRTAFSKAVEAAVTDRLKGSSPKGGGDPTPPDTDPFLAGFGK